MKNSLLGSAVAFALFFLCSAFAEEVNVSITSSDEDTGNMHYNEVMEIRLGEGEPCHLETSVEKGVIVPGICLKKKISDNEAFIFGHSSWGSGTQNVHAIRARYRDGKTELVEHLVVQFNRRQWQDVTLFLSDKNEVFLILPSLATLTDREKGDLRIETLLQRLDYKQIVRLPRNRAAIKGVYINDKSGKTYSLPKNRAIRCPMGRDGFTTP